MSADRGRGRWVAGVPDAVLAEHIARALLVYAQTERRNGRDVPIDLLDVARYLLDGDVRQDATKLGEARRAGQAGHVDEFLTKREAAAKIGLSVRTLERLVAAGELSCVRVGRSVRISRADLADFLAARRRSFRDAVEAKEATA